MLTNHTTVRTHTQTVTQSEEGLQFGRILEILKRVLDGLHALHQTAAPGCARPQESETQSRRTVLLPSWADQLRGAYDGVSSHARSHPKRDAIARVKGMIGRAPHTFEEAWGLMLDLNERLRNLCDEDTWTTTAWCRAQVWEGIGTQLILAKHEYGCLAAGLSVRPCWVGPDNSAPRPGSPQQTEDTLPVSTRPCSSVGEVLAPWARLCLGGRDTRGLIAPPRSGLSDYHV